MHFTMQFSAQLAMAVLLVSSAQALVARNADAHHSDNDLVRPHVIWSYSGLTVPDDLNKAIDAGKVGGVILFGENVKGGETDLPGKMKELQDRWSKSKSYDGLPLIITTDQEGGKVKRLPGGPTQSAKQVGNSSDPGSAATQMGKDAAAALTQFNNNANLAPVVDVFRTPGDFDDEFQRSFSSDPKVVSLCASNFIKSQQRAGILATVKHFPGLGAASTDENTDEQPVTLNVSLKDLRRIDEKPFKASIKAGVAMVMASWAVYPALDAKYPSGLSKKWIQGELRGRLGFKGVTITDALEAGSLNPFGTDPAHRAILATQAGMDIVLAAQRNVTQGQLAYDGLCAALTSGKLDKHTFKQATDRINKMRKTIK